jgi:hypothetical protein
VREDVTVHKGQEEREHTSLKFSLPNECSNAKVDCPSKHSNLQIVEVPSTPEHSVMQQIPHSSTTMMLPKKRKERQVVVVDTELRRSMRLKSQNMGFKLAGCGRKNCLGCDLDPPSLSTKVIRNLGKKFVMLHLS